MEGKRSFAVADGNQQMNCPYCRRPMVESKVAEATWYCWDCAIMVEDDEGEDVNTIHLPTKPR